VGSYLPPAELARQDSALLRKISVYFLLCQWEIYRSRGSVLDAVCEGTGRWPEHPVCYQGLVLLRLSTERRAPNAGCSLFMRPVWPDLSREFLSESTGRSECIRCEGVLQPSLRLSPVSTGPSGASSPVRL